MVRIPYIFRTAATAFAVAFVVYSCKSNLGVADSLDIRQTPVQTVDDMFVVQSENGILQMRMEADLMERYEKDTMSYELFPQGFAVYGYTDGGLLETEIISDNAIHETFEDKRETWKAYGNVVVRNIIKKEVLETDTLYWDRQNGKIYTDCYVKMYSPDGLIQGYGMESDERARNTIILKVFDNFAVVVQDSTATDVDSVNFIGPILKK